MVKLIHCFEVLLWIFTIVLSYESSENEIAYFLRFCVSF